MSVLIRGMDMPENCDKCQLTRLFGLEGGIECLALSSWPKTSYSEDEHRQQWKRPSWCPLVEIPSKHGRLFDETEVKRCLRELPDSEDKWSAIALLEWAIEKRCYIEAEDE